MIPDPSNPQSWNRYSYVTNDPIRYIDPTGHKACGGDARSSDDCQYIRLETASLKADLAQKYKVKLNTKWDDRHIKAVYSAVELVGMQFAVTRGQGETASSAFKAVYGLNDGDIFYSEWDENCWGCRKEPVKCDAGTAKGEACISAFGYTNTENWIEFASLSDVEVPLRNINNVIHELGHAFNLRLGRAPENVLTVRADLLVNGAGFYGYPGNVTWEQSSGANGSETFADQFLGWMYGRWGADPLGPVRADFMTQMDGANGWVAQAAALP